MNFGAVLVQPHERELSSVQCRVLFDPARWRPLATFVLEPASSDTFGEVCATEVVPASRHLALLHSRAFESEDEEPDSAERRAAASSVRMPS
jgi:hypothetical protein